MANSDAGHGKARSQKDQEMAARMKALGIERETGVCAMCYRVITVDSVRTRYRHVCRGGR
jgi:hypothetical protein